jgi:heme/copper-type cytochrome/quinol oxidase subunit 3
MFRNPIKNQEGIGLIAAIFLIVVVAMFGVLIARYTMISSQASAEDYLWSQALYAAEGAAQLRILNHDGGGGGWGWVDPTIQGFNLTWSSQGAILTAADLPSVIGASNVYDLSVQANKASISRTIEVRYEL